ncbi:MAG TPA: C2H2-type zinc finger protein [Nitrosopumilaceae archaeon]|nr:C2H2-type zinc finger protein [Nitrosopumilaceae archaeon]
MITVNCREVEAIKSALAVYVSDQIEAIPALKSHEFMLAPIDDQEKIDENMVVKSIKNFLDSIGEEENFAVISKNNVVSIVSINGKVLESTNNLSTDQFFSCTHCGYITRYETVYKNHEKIHYLV